MATGQRYNFASSSTSTGVIITTASPVRSGSSAINATATSITFGTPFPVGVGTNYQIGGHIVGSDNERVRFVENTMISSKTRGGFIITSGLAGTLSYYATANG